METLPSTTKTEISLSKANIERHIEIAQAPRLKVLPDKDINEPLRTAILKAYMNAGQSNFSNTAVEAMAMDLTRKLKTDFPNVSLRGILFAIDKGSYGDYLKENEILHISPANIVKWVKRYMEEERKEAMVELNKRLLEKENKEKPVPTPEELLKIKLEHVLNLYSCYKDGREFFGPKMAFEALEVIQFIKMSNDEKKALFETKKKEFYDTIHNAVSYQEKKQFSELLNKILNKPEVETEHLKDMCYTHCLNEVFKKWKEAPRIENNTLVW